MKNRSKRMLRSFLVPKFIVFGFSIFYFVWALLMWQSSSLWDFHKEIFVAVALLIASLGLVIDKAWSNLIAAVICGQLPFALLFEFWVLAKNAEVPLLGREHFRIWLEHLAY